jgi:hypothetical protein
MWGWETAEAMLRNADFSEMTRSVLPHDPMNVWFVSRTAAARSSADDRPRQVKPDS